MSLTKIEQLINEMYDFVDTCKPQPLSQTKIIVQKDQLLDLVDELKRRIPDEIKRYQKIISQRDMIIHQAEDKAAQIEEDAKVRAAALVDETEIMIQARTQANELIRAAKEESDTLRTNSRQDAERIRTGVLAYSSDLLNEVQVLLEDSYNRTKEMSEGLVTELKSKLDVIRENKKEIDEQYNINYDDDQAQTSDYTEDDLNFNEDTFLDGVD